MADPDTAAAMADDQQWRTSAQDPSGVPVVERVAAYPRPPALEPCGRQIRVEVFGRVFCETTRSLRVLETFHPPSFYLPPEACDASLLQPASGRSFCEWKGSACYFDLVDPAAIAAQPRRRRAVWHYPEPTQRFRDLAGWYALYPALVDGCWLDGEPVRPQPGGFYGGWISADLIGPFKGDPLHPELV
jgi:uncharacterized protein (DUF427 family)